MTQRNLDGETERRKDRDTEWRARENERHTGRQADRQRLRKRGIETELQRHGEKGRKRDR